MKQFNFYLASKSPRRYELLQSAHCRFELIDVNVDESKGNNEDPTQYVARMAYEKSKAGFIKADREYPCLGADTIVTFEGEIFGKPRDYEHAKEILLTLSGKTHEVITGVCLYTSLGKFDFQVSSRVTFHKLTVEEIKTYWSTGEPQDKAGAYAIQGIGKSFVEKFEGSLSNIIGLPLEETCDLLRTHSLL